MLFKWSERAVKILDHSMLRLNKFILKKIEHENKNRSDGGGHLVILILTLQREYGYYVYQQWRIQDFPEGGGGVNPPGGA